MDALMVELFKWGPVGVVAAIMLLFWRKQIAQAFLGSNNERVSEIMLSSMNDSFKENLTHFTVVSRDIPAMLVELRAMNTHMHDLVYIQRELMNEVSRQSGFMQGNKR